MTACAKRKTRVNIQNYSALRIVIISPTWANKELFSNGNRIKILFPIVSPILFGTVEQFNFMLNALCIIPFGQKGYSLVRRNIRLKVNMNIGNAPVFLEQILIYKVNVCNLLHFLLKSSVVLNINSVRHYNIRNVACPVYILCVYRNFYFCPRLHLLSPFIYCYQNYSLNILFIFSKKLLRCA